MSTVTRMPRSLRGAARVSSVPARNSTSVRATMCARPRQWKLRSMPTLTPTRPLSALLPRAVERFPDRVAVRHRQDGGWRDVTFAEVGEIATELARGLRTLGIAPGDRVALLCSTRPEWTYCDLA